MGYKYGKQKMLPGYPGTVYTGSQKQIWFCTSVHNFLFNDIKLCDFALVWIITILKWQILQIRIFLSGKLAVKHVPAQHYMILSFQMKTKQLGRW